MCVNACVCVVLGKCFGIVCVSGCVRVSVSVCVSDCGCISGCV